MCYMIVLHQLGLGSFAWSKVICQSHVVNKQIADWVTYNDLRESKDQESSN